MGSCAGRIFVLWLPTEAGMAVRKGEEDDRGMTDNDDASDDGDRDASRDDDLIVAEDAAPAQAPVVDTNDGRLAVDLDGDGRADAVAVDRNRDGRFDELALDRDRDGRVDMVITDDDFDGHADHLRRDPDVT